jgi:hypothetical protein
MLFFMGKFTLWGLAFSLPPGFARRSAARKRGCSLKRLTPQDQQEVLHRAGY